MNEHPLNQMERFDAESRSDEILERITATFARKGLDGSSMQDLASAAGMSVGNFYRYFPSKFALVEALVGRCARDVRRDFDAVRHETDIFVALRRMIEANRDEMHGDEAALWVHVDAAAVRHPEIAALKEAMEAGIRADVLAMLQREVAPSDAATAERLEDLADFMVILVSGLFRRIGFADPDVMAERFARLTTMVIDTARDRLDVIRAAASIEIAQ